MTLCYQMIQILFLGLKQNQLSDPSQFKAITILDITHLVCSNKP